MSKNRWRYANLTEGDKLEKVGRGNTELYRIESEQNKSLKNLYQEAGLDTSKIDKWQSQLDSARSEAVANIPKYSNDPMYSLAWEDLRNARRMAEDALKSVKSASATIDEDYVNRGIKFGNADYTEKKQYLKKAFLDEIERLSKTYGMTIFKNYGERFYGKYKRIADDLLG